LKNSIRPTAPIPASSHRFSEDCRAAAPEGGLPPTAGGLPGFSRRWCSMGFYPESRRNSRIGENASWSETPRAQTFENPDAGESCTFTFFNLTWIARADGSSKRFTHDDRGNVKTPADADGATWSLTLNGQWLATAL